MSLVGYYRVSTQMQGRSGLSLEAQQAAVREHARRKSDTLVAEFTEVESGRNCTRPKLKQALATAKEQDATLVVAKLDRLARDTSFTLSILDSGASVCFLDLPDMGSEPFTTRLIITVMSAFAEWESRRIGQRIKDAIAAKRKRAADRKERYVSRPVPKRVSRLGAAAWHRMNRERCELFRVEHYPLLLGLREGRTLVEVAAEMNRRGIRTVRKRKWSAGTVWHILRSKG